MRKITGSGTVHVFSQSWNLEEERKEGEREGRREEGKRKEGKGKEGEEEEKMEARED